MALPPLPICLSRSVGVLLVAATETVQPEDIEALARALTEELS